MHILVTNDDGPPSNASSPYIHSLITTLQSAGHVVSVVIPHVQRSWIGKAHFVGKTVTASYFRPGTLHEDDGVTSQHPFDDGKEEWVLIDGTPASCVQIGIWHLHRDRGPVDLVVSGPNYGRNSSALYVLSSGTIGAAMEAAVCGKRAVALSYAFDRSEHNPVHIAAASQISVKLIEKLSHDWAEHVHVYNVNVPLGDNISKAKIVYTEVLENRWATGSCFKEVELAEQVDPAEQERDIREGKQNGISPARNGNGNANGRNQKSYKWAPNASDVQESVRKGGPGSDGWALKDGMISVTPLKANFLRVPNIDGEIKLPGGSIDLGRRVLAPSSVSKLYAIIDYPDPYVQPLIIDAVGTQLPGLNIELISSIEQLPSPDSPVLQITAYESLDFEHAIEHPKSSLIGAYVIRKALIRKHYLSNTISMWLVKHPDSLLRNHFKATVNFELDYAEFLDESLVDAWDLHESMRRNEAIEDGNQKEREWWILKPGMSDGANGIRLFCSMEQLQGIFEEWEGDEEDSEVVGTDEEDGRQSSDEAQGYVPAPFNRVMTSQLRHFVAQPYIDPPLLLTSRGNRKFHVRVYVLAVGALKVYVSKEMLALFAANPYTSPSQLKDGGEVDLASHLTNTCLQTGSARMELVTRFWDLSDALPNSGWKESIFEQICQVTGEVFEAAARDQVVHFQVLPNAFEIFGVDFLVDAGLNVWLLELNAYPDFKQTGHQLRDSVIGGLIREVVQNVVQPYFDQAMAQSGRLEKGEMVLVREMDLGRR